MADVAGKKIDIMFTSYKKTVTNIFYDHVFEDDCLGLDFYNNFFYTDHVLLNAASWIDSRQWDYYPDDATEIGGETDEILDVYF